MNGNFTVCCAKEEDLSAWILLVKELRENFPGLDMADYTKTLQKNISRETALCAKTQEGVIAGILLFSPRLKTLSCMAVHPACRRRGIGRALILKMLERMPPGDVSVTTFREGDPMGEAPRALYRSLGFLPGELETEFDYPVQRFVLHRGPRDT
ncbi:MAG: GNAT family N-acetyltransferase [Provencibacterium sp.]|jgi:ribosomal protein S18 acetylase RimI-like enzyme|nr:GNAT family N-acetyltransferase [Provencibacterium sp.]